jgi:hypothetical protein
MNLNIEDFSSIILEDPSTYTEVLYSKYFYDHTFKVPVGLGYMPSLLYPPPHREQNLVAIRSFILGRDTTINRRNRHEYEKKSLYRSYGAEYGVPVDLLDESLAAVETQNGAFILPRTQSVLQQMECSTDRVQKFPSRQIQYILDANDEVDRDRQRRSTQRVDSSRISDPAWYQEFGENRNHFSEFIDRTIDSFNMISFKMQEPSETWSFVRSLHESGLDTMFLEMLDQLFPSKATYYTQVLNGILNHQIIDNRSRLTATSDIAAVNLLPNEIIDPIKNMIIMLYGAQNAPDSPSPANGDGSFHGRPRFSYENDFDISSYPMGFFGFENVNQITLQLPENTSDIYINATQERRDYMRMPGFGEAHVNFVRYSDIFFSGPSDLTRSGLDIILGKPAYSEVLAYRVEKLDAQTDEVIQNFYFFNNPNTRDFRFYDSQVLQSKTYKYKIYTINLVIGSKYSYEISKMKYVGENPGLNQTFPGHWSDASDPQANADPNEHRLDKNSEAQSVFSAADIATIKIPMSIENDIRLIEAPYYEQEITTMREDLPPLYPMVQIYQSHRTTGSNPAPTLFTLQPQHGHIAEPPIQISEEDLETLNQMIQRQVGLFSASTGQLRPGFPDLSSSWDGQIEYKSDSVPTHYEMFYMFDRPRSYIDFAHARKLKTPASSPYFDVDVPLNKKIYIIFRTIDLGGFSNPGPIYEFVKQNHGDGSYISFDILRLDDHDHDINFERMIKISPAAQQKQITFNPDDTTKSNLPDYLSAQMRPGQNENDPYITAPPDMSTVGLGSALFNPVWNRDFKFRFKSKSSGNSFDLNVTFTFNKNVHESLHRSSQSTANDVCPPSSDDNTRSRRREDNRERDEELRPNVRNNTFQNKTTVTVPYSSPWTEQDSTLTATAVGNYAEGLINQAAPVDRDAEAELRSVYNDPNMANRFHWRDTNQLIEDTIDIQQELLTQSRLFTEMMRSPSVRNDDNNSVYRGNNEILESVKVLLHEFFMMNIELVHRGESHTALLEGIWAQFINDAATAGGEDGERLRYQRRGNSLPGRYHYHDFLNRTRRSAEESHTPSRPAAANHRTHDPRIPPGGENQNTSSPEVYFLWHTGVGSMHDPRVDDWR